MIYGYNYKLFSYLLAKKSGGKKIRLQIQKRNCTECETETVVSEVNPGCIIFAVDGSGGTYLQHVISSSSCPLGELNISRNEEEVVRYQSQMPSQAMCTSKTLVSPVEVRQHECMVSIIGDFVISRRHRSCSD